MVFEKGHDRQPTLRNNKDQRISGWRLGRTIRGRMEEIVDEMFSLLKDEDAGIRLGVIKVLLDRGLGKVPEAIEFSGPAGGPLKITFEAVVPVKQQHVIELDEQSVKHLSSVSQTSSRVRK